ncbi:SPRY-domain-containing protein [Myriangium duriaei CBS 260.36]|uniref:SPRY-domain-containing protein n=1 Tax=Myriangium duriaei CBS 260.36 TaxID=1168546 RepID=A0A9P4IZX4_9PEZI|nr:SPRY-domain-containing protein [Myriangium duriaei CBS 260.36]
MEGLETDKGSGEQPKYKSSPTEASVYFVPSYLRKSRYMERLEGLHKQRQQTKKETRGPYATPALGSRQASSSNLSLHKATSGSAHRGVSHDVIERLPPLQSNERPNSIPTRWSDTDKCSGIEILGNGAEVKYQGTIRTPDDAVAVRSDHPIPQECGLYYYEVTIMSRGKEGLIGIGFSGTKPSLNRLPGWEADSWGYHGDDGYTFACSSAGKTYGPKFSALDVVGCGINFRTGAAFFTKNGIFLGDAFQGIKLDRLYPSVGIKKPGEHLRTNFGQTPFVFDIDSMVEKERRIVRAEINRFDLKHTPLFANLDETDTVKELIAQYLAHEGFTETGSQFARDVREQEQALKASGQAAPSLIESDDMSATYRQKIRAAILGGDIDKAFKYLGAYFPRVIEHEANRDIYFRLRCRKFIEMILRSYEVQAGINASDGRSEDGVSPVTNGHGQGGPVADPKADGMDLDGHPVDTSDGRVDLGDSMETSTDNLKNTPSFAETNSAAMMHNELLGAAIQYGMELQAEFSNDPRKEVKKALNDTFALIAYTDARESVLAEMMEGKGRIEIAEQVNGAILVSLGKPRSALLEQLCAQTDVLVDMLSEEGGPAAFVNLHRDYLQ